MAKDTNISWCDHTFNPVIGCQPVSPGCAHCYAASWAKRHGRDFSQRTRTKTWSDPVKWNKAAGELAVFAPSSDLQSPHRPRVFGDSLCDWLDDQIPIEVLSDFLELIRITPNLDWLLLTKRPQNFKPLLSRILEMMGNHLTYQESCLKVFITLMLEGWGNSQYISPDVGRENYWIGVTVEDQKRADERIPLLLAIPSTTRFLSCEPLLGPVDLHLSNSKFKIQNSKSPISWIIAGGESGPGARPMHRQWPRSLRDQCHASKIPFFFKQWGEWGLSAPVGKNGAWDFSGGRTLADDGTVYQPGDLAFPNGPRYGEAIRKNHNRADLIQIYRNGTKKNGHLLDGCAWQEFPNSQVK